MIPYIAYTTCSYARRDGKRVEDASAPKNAQSFQSVAESAFFNAVSYYLHESPTEGQALADILHAWFISDDTAMSPDLKFGQIIRGPDSRHPTDNWSGVLDLRGMVKVLNALDISLDQKRSAWREQYFPDHDIAAMAKWVITYRDWMRTSPAAQTAKGKPK